MSIPPAVRPFHRSGEADIVNNPIAATPSWIVGFPFPSFVPVMDPFYERRIEAAKKCMHFWYGDTGDEPVNFITHIQDFKDKEKLRKMSRLIDILI